MIDRELVTRKMVLISEDLRRLETLAAKDLAAIRRFLDTTVS